MDYNKIKGIKLSRKLKIKRFRIEEKKFKGFTLTSYYPFIGTTLLRCLIPQQENIQPYHPLLT